MEKKITISWFNDAKEQGRKFAAVSCYDYTSASLVSQSPVEMILVGDSAAQFMLGRASTLRISMDFMVAITTAVRKAAPDLLLVADMPFMSYQVSIADAIRNAGRFFAEAGAQIVKIEAASAQIPTIKAITEAGIPTMAHIGIRPQTGPLKAQAATAAAAVELIELADRMTEAGSSMLLLEGTTRETAKIITKRVSVPVVGCGSGPDCDGQVLVLPDILKLTSGRIPKFSKSFADIGSDSIKAISVYADEVKNGTYPDDEHSYHMKKGELDKLNFYAG